MFCMVINLTSFSYDMSVRNSIMALDLPDWSEVVPSAGKWDFTGVCDRGLSEMCAYRREMIGAWHNSTPYPTTTPPAPTGYPDQINSTGISKGALAGELITMVATAHAALADDSTRVLSYLITILIIEARSSGQYWAPRFSLCWPDMFFGVGG